MAWAFQTRPAGPLQVLADPVGDHGVAGPGGWHGSARARLLGAALPFRGGLAVLRPGSLPQESRRNSAQNLGFSWFSPCFSAFRGRKQADLPPFGAPKVLRGLPFLDAGLLFRRIAPGGSELAQIQAKELAAELVAVRREPLGHHFGRKHA